MNSIEVRREHSKSVSGWRLGLWVVVGLLPWLLFKALPEMFEDGMDELVRRAK